MEATVSGKVIFYDKLLCVVECKNGRIVKTFLNSSFGQDEMPNLNGRTVQVEGKAYYSDGEIEVFAEKITVEKIVAQDGEEGFMIFEGLPVPSR